MSVVGLVPLAAPASAATLYAAEVGPVDETTGYPFWFGDSTGTRLELCLDDLVMCPVIGELPTPGRSHVDAGKLPRRVVLVVR